MRITRSNNSDRPILHRSRRPTQWAAWIRAMHTGVADANPYDGIDAEKLDLWTFDQLAAEGTLSPVLAKPAGKPGLPAKCSASH